MEQLDSSDKRKLLDFLASYYDIPRERLDNVLDENKLPDKPGELPFVRNKNIYKSDDKVGTFSDEFCSRVEYLDDFLRYNFTKPPGFHDSYVYQPELNQEEKLRARENPRIATRSLLDEEKYQELLSRIEDQVDFLSAEIDNCNLTKNVKNQIRLILALMRYGIGQERGTDIQNAFRPLRYISSNVFISERKYINTYSRIGSKLNHMFEDENAIADSIYKYYNGNMNDLVNTINTSLDTEE